MKKLSLATILVLSTVGTALFAQAETNQPVAGFQDGSQPTMNQNANMPQRGPGQGMGFNRQWNDDRPYNRFDRQRMDGSGPGMGQGMRPGMGNRGQGRGYGLADCPYVVDGQFGYGGQGAGYGRQMGGGFLNGGFLFSESPSKVADAASWNDDQPIVLEGKIIKQVGRKDFVFQDASGELTLEIVGRAWHGQTITPNDQVKVVAGVEKSWGKTEVFGLYVEKIPSAKTNP